MSDPADGVHPIHTTGSAIGNDVGGFFPVRTGRNSCAWRCSAGDLHPAWLSESSRVETC